MTRNHHGICQNNNRITRKQIVAAYAGWTQQHIEQGGEAYLLTFMFDHLGTKERAIIEQMKPELECFYGKLITRFNRKPRSFRQQYRNPKIIMCPDRPILKNDKTEMSEVRINNGVHAHGIGLTTTKTRKGRSLDQEILQEQHYYLADTALIRVHAKPITYDPIEAATYAFKAYGKGHFLDDDLHIFPRSVSELRWRSFTSHLNQRFFSQYQ